MFLYGWLHLAGYDLPLEEVKNFRALHSITPGHPEFHRNRRRRMHHRPARPGRRQRRRLRAQRQDGRREIQHRRAQDLDNHVIALAGDGCLQEGVAREAVAFAAHNGLDNLILIFDSNDVTLDAMAKLTQSEDTAEALRGARLGRVDRRRSRPRRRRRGHRAAPRSSDNGKPKIIIARTLIGKGIPEVAGTAKAHGEGGAKFVDAARKALGLPEGTHFYVSDEVRAYFADLKRAAQPRAQALAARPSPPGPPRIPRSRPNSTPRSHTTTAPKICSSSSPNIPPKAKPPRATAAARSSITSPRPCRTSSPAAPTSTAPR